MDGKETWKEIPGYGGSYLMSNWGRVKSLKRGEVLLRPSPSRGGFLSVSLKRGRSKKHFIHLLVAESFLNRPKGKTQLKHINGQMIDNRAGNLEWVTLGEGPSNPYQKNPLAKPVIQMKSGIPLKHWEGVRISEREGGYHPSHVSACCRGKMRSHKGYQWMFATDFFQGGQK